MEVYVDDETKLTLHGLQQHYVKLQESEKNRKLFDLIDLLEFNQVCMFCLNIVVDNTMFMYVFILLGGDICPYCSTLCSSQSPASGTSLPFNMYSSWYGSRGKVSHYSNCY